MQNSANRDAHDRLVYWLLLVAGSVLYLSFGYTEMAGSDMWWHVAAGRELLQTRTLWMVDDWSYTEFGSDWLNHEWLSDIIYYGWVSLWGVETLVYWKWLVMISTFLLLQLALVRSSGNVIAAFICSAMAIAIAAPFLDVRPHLYTLLNFSLLLFLLLGRKPNLWILVPLFIVWVNLHGGFFFGLMALAILLFPWRDLNVKSVQAAAMVGIACLLAAILNPSGFGTFLYPLKYAFDETSPFRTLGEWLAPSKPGGIRSPLFFIFQWAPLAALLYALPQVRRRIDVPWEGLCLTALTLAMALTSRRFIPIFAISLAVLLAPLLGLLFQQLKMRVINVGLAVLFLVLCAWRLSPYPLKPAPAFHYLVAEYSYPIHLVDFMQKNQINGKVYAYYNWGGYLHWRTDGAMKVNIDGRADTLFDAQTYNDYVAVLFSRQDWIELIESSSPDFILWPNVRGKGRTKLSQLLQTGRWEGIYRDSEGWLLARKELQLANKMQPPPDGALRDLTYAWAGANSGKVELALENIHKVREAIPWHKRACDILIGIYRQQGDQAKYNETMASCRKEFPSQNWQ
jgi:hypothetical protein